MKVTSLRGHPKPPNGSNAALAILHSSVTKPSTGARALELRSYARGLAPILAASPHLGRHSLLRQQAY
jgi:hypothetical protein